MSLQHAKTIQIFLPSGEPRGLRIAEITTRNVKAIQAPRSQVDKLLERPEASQPVCYFLFGESDTPGRGMVYSGQTEDLAQRLKCHDDNKDFWSSVVVVLSSTNTFTQTHIRYLEWLSISKAAGANRYHLDNGNRGSKPHAPEPVEADIMDAFDTTVILLSTLGFPLFEPLLAAANKNGEASTADEEMAGKDSPRVFRCSGAGVTARGEWTKEGFVIYEGSLVRKEVTKSRQSNETYMKKRMQYVADGTLVEDSTGNYRLSRNLILPSPSGAATLIFGNHCNGWTAWVSEDTGNPLDYYYRDVKGGTAGSASEVSV